MSEGALEVSGGQEEAIEMVSSVTDRNSKKVTEAKALVIRHTGIPVSMALSARTFLCYALV